MFPVSLGQIRALEGKCSGGGKRPRTEGAADQGPASRCSTRDEHKNLLLNQYQGSALEPAEMSLGIIIKWTTPYHSRNSMSGEGRGRRRCWMEGPTSMVFLHS